MVILGFLPLAASIVELNVGIRGYSLAALFVFLPFFILHQHRSTALQRKKVEVMTNNVMSENGEVNNLVWTGQEHNEYLCTLAYTDGTSRDHRVMFHPETGKPAVR